MAKRIAETPRAAAEGARLKRYAEIARALGGAHAQTLSLQQRPREGRDEAKRAREFLRIERGRTA